MRIINSNFKQILLFTESFLLMIFLTKAYELIQLPCQTTFKQQSPINIDTGLVKYREERFFRVVATNYTNINATWKAFSEDKAIGFEGNFGSVVVTKDWSLYRFNLTKVIFSYISAHTINDKFYDMEMELIHSIDKDFRPPGRYIQPSAEYLVISVFFSSVDDSLAVPKSMFFNYMNLESLSLNPKSEKIYFNRKIKLNTVVQHTTGFFYQGTLSSGFCETAWRILLPKYQVINISEYAKIKGIFIENGFITSNGAVRSNTRSRQLINPGVEIYRNDVEAGGVLIEATKLQYDIIRLLRVDHLTLIFGLFLMLLA